MRLWLLLLVLCTTPALSHDDAQWIRDQWLRDPVTGQFCCGVHDCERTEARAVPGGYLIEITGEVIPHDRVVWKSRDGWWRCRHTAGEKKDQTRCLIGVLPGS